MNYQMVKTEKSTFIKFDFLNKFDFIDHLYTTRIGEFNKGAFWGFNMGYETNDVAEDVAACNEYLNSYFCDSHVIYTRQTHTNRVDKIDETNIDSYNSKEKVPHEVDGFITNLKGIALRAIYADCVPLYFVDEKKQAIGIIHSGWKGTLKKIAVVTVKKMVEEYGCELRDINILIGPSISKEYFEVGHEVVDDFKRVFSFHERIVDYSYDKPHIDLWETNRLMLIELGIPETNISISGLCSYKNEDLFYSYRRDGVNTGRMSAMIMIRP